MTPEGTRASELAAEVRTHKSEIRRRRFLLSKAKAELTTLRAECEKRGIRLIIHGEGRDSHGQGDGTPT